MAESFDPYHKWLAIPKKDQPPNYYRLLGLDLFEGDPDVIEHAADQRMRHIRSMATGKHVATSQQILNEIAAARVCLLHPQQKVAYDAALKEQMRAKDTASAGLGGRAVAAAAQPAVPSPILIQTSERAAPDGHPASSLHVREPAMPPWMGMVIGGAAAAAALVLALLLMGRSPPEPPIVQGPAEPLKQPAAPASSEAPQPASGSNLRRPEAIEAAPVAKPGPSGVPAGEASHAEAVKNIEAADGMFTEEFALCQTLPLEQFSATAEALRPAGYRPLRARPYATPEGVLMAAVWTRDNAPWVFKSGLSPEELQAENERQASEGFTPADVAAWQAESGQRLTLGLWARTGENPEKFEIYAAVPHAQQQERYEDCRQRGLRPVQRHAFLGSDDQLYHSFLWNRHGRAFYIGAGHPTFYERQLQPNRFQLDIGVRRHLSNGRRNIWYYGIWEITTKRQSEERHGLPPDEHLEQCRKLAAEGKRPVAIGVLFVSPGQPWLAASVWHY